MAMTPTGIARTAGLVILIVCAIGSIVVDFFFQNNVWGWFKIVVCLLVIGFEIGNYIVKKKTISTEQKDFMIRNWFWGGLSLILFGLSLAGLILHLSVW